VGRLFLANAAAATVVLAPLLILLRTPQTFLLGLLWAFFAGAIFQGAMFAFANDMRRFRDPGLGDFFRAVKTHAAKALISHIVFAIAAIVLAVNAKFWANPPIMPEILTWPGRLLAGVSVWAIVFLGMCYLFHLPLQIEGGHGPFGALKRAALLALANPVPTIASALTFVGIEMLILGTLLGPFLSGLAAGEDVQAGMQAAGLYAALLAPALGGSALWAALSASLYTTLLYRYTRQEQQESEEKAAPPTSWKQIMAQEKEAGDATGRHRPGFDVDGEPIRKLSDLWRPWGS
jgi:hypothetical protein